MLAMRQHCANDGLGVQLHGLTPRMEMVINRSRHGAGNAGGLFQLLQRGLAHPARGAKMHQKRPLTHRGSGGRSMGKECDSKCSTWGWPCYYKKDKTINHSS